MSNVPLFVWPVGPIINTEPIRYVVNKTDHDLVVDALREQNQVLREALEQAYDDIPGWVTLAKAALTATSQPAQEQCSYCKRPLTDNHSFSYGVPGVPRVYKCDRADCTKPATSQEGPHESR